jgi:hypothetical protein
MAIKFVQPKVKTINAGKAVKDFFTTNILGPKLQGNASKAGSKAGVRGGKPMAGAPKAGAKARGGKPMAGEVKSAVKTPVKVRGNVSMSGDSIKAIPAKKKAPAKAKVTTKLKGDDSFSQHESFRKELEAGGGRAAWSMNKQVEAGGAKVEISKPSAGTGLNAELDKFQASSGKTVKKDVKLGLVGRTGGKWHLGKKAGKG